MSDLPKGWTTVTLGEVVHSAGTKAGDATGFPVYSVTKYDGFVPSDEYFKKQVYSRDLSTYKRVRAGDFAYATIHLDEGSIGIAPTDALISPMYTAFSIDLARVHPAYLLHYLKSPRAMAQYDTLGSGSVHRRRSISLKRLSSLPVPLPPLTEQRRIATILDTVAQIEGNRRRHIRLVTQLPSSLFETTGQGSQAFRLEELGDLTGGLTLGPKRKSYDDQIPYLRVANVMRGRLDLETIKTTGATEREKRQKLLQSGDLLIVEGHGRLDEIGRTAMWSTEEKVMSHQNHLFRFRPDPKLVTPEFLMAYLNSRSGSRGIQNLATTTSGLNTLSGKKLKTLRVPLPDMSAQRSFTDRYRSIAAHLELLNSALSRHRRLSASLRSRAFQGGL